VLARAESMFAHPAAALRVAARYVRAPAAPDPELLERLGVRSLRSIWKLMVCFRTAGAGA